MALKRLNVFWQVFIEEDELLIYSRSKGGFVLSWTITCGNGISIASTLGALVIKENKGGLE